MTKKNQKHKHKQENEQSTPQPVAPATPLELSEEELGQVGGGSMQWGANETPPSIGVGGLPIMNVN